MSIKVEIKQSTVESFGKGLFTKIPITKGSVIAQFVGQLRKPSQSVTSSWSNIHFSDNYILECDSNNLASFAKDAIDFPTDRRFLLATLKSSKPFYNKHPSADINASIKINNKTHKAYLIADTNIPTSTEIFCHYGFPYWFKQELTRGFLQEEEIELNGYPNDIFTYPSFSAYIKTFYPQSTKFEINPYKDYFDIIIHIGDGNLVLMPLDNYFKKLKKIFIEDLTQVI